MKIKRFLGVILTVIMIMSLTPTMAAEAVEAKWGATGGELEYSGSFTDAITALSGDGWETNMTVVLQSDVASGNGNTITAGEHIIDLNGHTVNLSVGIGIGGGKLTVKDSVGGGQMICESSGSRLFSVDGELCIEGGTFEGYIPVYVGAEGTADISGGTFIPAGAASVEVAGTANISGGILNSGYGGAVYSYGNTTITDATLVRGNAEADLSITGGKLDLSGRADIEGVMVVIYGSSDGEAIIFGENIILPEGYYLYNTAKGKAETGSLERYNYYEARTGTLKAVTFVPNGGEGVMTGHAVYGEEYILPECTFTYPGDRLAFTGWLVEGKGTLEAGTVIMADTDLVLTAQWAMPVVEMEITNNSGASFSVSLYVNGEPEYTFTGDDYFAFEYDIINTYNIMMDSEMVGSGVKIKLTKNGTEIFNDVLNSGNSGDILWTNKPVKYGASATDEQMKQGTLQDAFTAAADAESGVKYAELLTDVEDEIYSLSGGELTLNMADHNIYYGIFADAAIFNVSGGAKLTLTGGYIDSTYGNIVKISDDSTLTINDVDFNDGSKSTIVYEGGKINFETAAKGNLSIYNATDEANVTDVLSLYGNDKVFLPDGYGGYIQMETLVSGKVSYIGELVAVTFDPNGGEGEPRIEKVFKYSFIGVSHDEFYKEGYEICGWNTEADGSGSTFTERHSVLIGSDTTLYAMWEKICDVYVGGVPMEDGDYLASGADETTKTKPGSSYAYYKDGILYLNNYTYEGMGYSYDEYSSSAGIYIKDYVTIRVSGKNRIAVNGESEDPDGYLNKCDGIYSDYTIKLEGNGSLEIIASDDGIDVGDDSLRIYSGEYTLVTGDHGFDIEYSLYIYGGKITMRAGDDGFNISEDIVIKGGEMDIYADDYTLDAVYGSIYISGGTIKLFADDYTGIDASEGEIHITGGKIAITADEYAMSAYDIYISGSDTAVYCQTHEIYGSIYLEEDDFETVVCDEGFLTMVEGTEVSHSFSEDMTVTDDGHFRACTHEDCLLPRDAEFYEYLTEGGESVGCLHVQAECEECGYMPLPPADVEIIVGGRGLVSGSFLDENGVISDTMPEGGYAYYEDGILTLDNFNYVNDGIHDGIYITGTEERTNFTIMVMGDNSIICESQGNKARGIYVNSANLDILGDGTLTIDAYDGIYSSAGMVHIYECTLNINADDDGIEIYENSVYLTDCHANIYAQGRGVYADEAFEVSGGVINVKAEEVAAKMSRLWMSRDAAATLEGGCTAVWYGNELCYADEIYIAESIFDVATHAETGMYTYIDDEWNYIRKLTFRSDSLAATQTKITGYSLRAAQVDVTEEGEYTFFFVDYDEDGNVSGYDVVTEYLEAGAGQSVSQKMKGFSLGSGDKVMLWKGMVPVCSAYEI